MHPAGPDKDGLLYPRVGVLGGGQLGRMMCYAAHRLGVQLTCLDPGGAVSPAGQAGARVVAGSFRDAAKIKELSECVDVLTTEIEHVDAAMLAELEAAGVKVYPGAAVLALLQDKLAQKRALQSAGTAMPLFMPTPTAAAARVAGAAYGYPLMLKSRRFAYDGKGNAVAHSAEEVDAAFAALGGAEASASPVDAEGAIFAEKWVPFARELAVMVAVGAPLEAGGADEMRCYPVVQTVQRDSICHLVLAPAEVPAAVLERAESLARKAVAALGTHTDAPLRGVFGVELFLMPDGSLLYNEMAPRPHNSGHYTLEASRCDQFEQHLRGVLGMPLGDTAFRWEARRGGALMVNVLGGASDDETLTPVRAAASVTGASLHWYGKPELRAGRKLGHVTVVAHGLRYMSALRAAAKELCPGTDFAPLNADGFAGGGGGGESGVVVGGRGDGGGAVAAAQPAIGIIMGSDSDLPCMKAAAAVLSSFGVPFELTIVSAHRTPKRMVAYAEAAAQRGLKVLIAGAGGAAHLPGMVAALTTLPVIGVPVKSSALSGVDSLYSIVQMPRGIPVATMAIGNATNAALLAVRMLGAAGLYNCEAQMGAYLAKHGEEVEAKAECIENIGWEKYLEGMENKSTTVM